MADLLPNQQIENELALALGEAASSAARPRTSTGKLKRPTGRPQRHVMPTIRPRKAGGGKNLRRAPGPPARDPFDQLSSPDDKGKSKSRSRALPETDFSPRRKDVPRTANLQVASEVTERQANAGAAPILTAPNNQQSPRRSLRKRSAGSTASEDIPSDEVVDRLDYSPVAYISSQALANAVENDTSAEDGSDDHEPVSPHEPAQPLEIESSSKPSETTKRKAGKSRSSKPVASKARKPATGGIDQSPPPAVPPAIKKIRPQSLYPDEEGLFVSDDSPQRPPEHTLDWRRKVKEHHNPASQALKDMRNGNTAQSRNRKATTTQIAAPPFKNPKLAHRTVQLLGQQSRLREAYEAVNEIGWAYKDGEKHRQSEVDLDDEQVMKLKELCDKATSKLSSLLDPPDDEEILSDPPEELEMIWDEVRALGQHQAYFRDADKVNNIYFHLFRSLVKLVRHTIDCYAELDKDEDGLTPQRSITIFHLNIVATLIKVITSLHEIMMKRYCEPQEGLCVKKPVKAVVVHLQSVQDRFYQEVRRHREREQQELEDRERAEEEAMLEERLEREEAIAKQHAEIRKKWLSLHEERRHADANILPRWKIAHLSVPELEPDRDANGETFERVEVFAPRIGPSVASTEKARQVEWSAIELDALREGLEEFAGPRLFVKMFRRYCRRGAPLNRFNVTEIVTIAADMREWAEDQQRRTGIVEDWVQEIKPYMLTRGRMYGAGQENSVVGDA